MAAAKVAECGPDKPCPAGQVCENDHCVAPKCDLKRIHFDYNMANLTSEAESALKDDAECLAKMKDVSVTIEGHCDERGTTEYNQHLGEKRAKSAMKYLVNLGVSASRLSVVSYGKERPLVEGHDEASWAKNRRADFVVR